MIGEWRGLSAERGGKASRRRTGHRLELRGQHVDLAIQALALRLGCHVEHIGEQSQSQCPVVGSPFAIGLRPVRLL